MDVSAPFQSLLNARFLEIFHYFGNKMEPTITPKMADKNFFTNMHCVFNRIPIESLKIRNSNACIFLKSFSPPSLP